ncbi:MAG: RHS repeat protein [Pseudomonadales bacterium]|nr:RHS repeat protein [Pseudomonadales bacterium]
MPKLYFILLIAITSCLSHSAIAHTLSTHQITIDDPDDQDASASFVLLDPGGFSCPSLVTISVDPDTAVKVDPAGPIEIAGSQLFVVTPLQSSSLLPDEVKITLKWAHGPAIPSPSDPCYQAMDAGESDAGTEMVTLTIIKPKLPATTVANTATPAVTPTDPIAIYSGEFFMEESPDISLGGPLPVVFRRYHASGLRSTASLGNNWLHNFHFTLSGPDNGEIIVTDNRGRILTFQQSGNTYSLISPTFAGYQLVETDAGYTLGDVIESRLYHFDDAGILISIQDRSGNTQTLTYDNGNLIGVSDALGRSLSMSYNEDNRIVSVSDGIRTVQFAYTGGNLTSFIDVRGNEVRYEYDNAAADVGLMTNKVLPLGNTLTAQVWDDDGLVSSQSDGNQNGFHFSYGSNSTTVQTDPLGNTREYEFNTDGLLVSLTDEIGETSTYGYDSAGRVISQTDSLGYTTRQTYDPASGKLRSYTEPDGSVSNYTYTSQVQQGIEFRVLTRVTYPDGSAQDMTYDTNGNMTGFTDRGGRQTSVTYNARGQVLTMTNPAGGTSTFAYTADGTVSSIIDPAGNTTTLGYDALRRADLVTHPDGSTRSYTFDSAGNMLSETDELGNSATFTYDANGNLTTITDPLGYVTNYSYDAMDRLVSVTDPNGNSTSRSFDGLGRIASRTDRNGNTLTFDYDPAGRRTSITDAAGNEWTQTYDSEGFALNRTNPLNNTWSYQRDDLGRTISSTSPDNATWTFDYSPAGRISRFSDPTGTATEFSADPRGILSGISQGDGLVEVVLEHNDIGLLTRLTDENGQDWNHAYDSYGRKLSATDPLGRTTTMTYDNRNRLTQINYPEQLGSVQLSYDARSNLTRKLYSDGTDLNYTYDEASQLIAATGLTLAYDKTGEIISSNGIDIERDAGGRMVSVSFAPGKTVNYIYDSRDLLIKVTDWVGGETTFNYDVASRLTSMTRPSGVTATYTYNAEDKVTGIQENAVTPLSSLSMQRDGRGRITSETRNLPVQGTLPDGTITMSYDAASQLSGAAYDAIGRLLDTGGRNYNWNMDSRLLSYLDNGATVSMTYDALGRRLSRTSSGVSRAYVWNYALTLPSISIVRQGGSDLRYYVHAPGGALLYSIEAADDARHFYHFDASGNTLYLTDDSGTVTDAYAYTPFGTLLAQTGNTDNPFTFAGQMGAMQETPTGLYYIRARYYDAVVARFLTRDPARRSPVPGEANVYGYARMNPILFGDPSGLNAKVNNDGTHTDITVDVWQRGEIIGTLNVSFGEGGYREGGGGSSGGSSGGVLLNGRGTFFVEFKPGQCVDGSVTDPNLIGGGRVEDERVARAMLSAVDFSSVGLENRAPGTPAGDFIQKRIKELGPTESGESRSIISWSKSAIKGSGPWDTYGVFNGRTCNTFTGEMVNVYFGGTEWSTGILQSSVTDNINLHRAELQLKHLNDASGIAPVPR